MSEWFMAGVHAGLGLLGFLFILVLCLVVVGSVLWGLFLAGFWLYYRWEERQVRLDEEALRKQVYFGTMSVNDYRRALGLPAWDDDVPIGRVDEVVQDEEGVRVSGILFNTEDYAKAMKDTAKGLDSTMYELLARKKARAESCFRFHGADPCVPGENHPGVPE